MQVMTTTLAPATTVPRAAAREARLLVDTHRCVVCRTLPERPFIKADVDPGQDYRPRKPAEIVSGKTPRSFRCKRHERARKVATSANQRAADKTYKFGLSRALQQALWEFQGCACACGRKRAPQVPAGVTLDHDHGAECIARGDHPENRGCLGCCTGFLCRHCNRDIIGRLEAGKRTRADVAASLAGLHAHVTDPPLARLLAERPDLLESAA